MPTVTPSTKACRSAAMLGRTVGRALDAAQLTPAGYRLLAYLSGGGSSAATVLAEKLAVSRPTITATTQWLESRGYVARTPGVDDRRRISIAITPAGDAALAEADQLVSRRLAEVLGFVPGSKVRSIVAALECLHDALNEHRAHRHGLTPELAGE